MQRNTHLRLVLPPEARRGDRFTLWLSPAEKDELRAAARAEGLPMGAYIRRQLGLASEGEE